MSAKTSILFSLGLEAGVTYETIVTTVAANGEYNAAPMGIRSEDGVSVIFRPFKSTRTYSNLVATKAAVANFTDDPHLFLIAAMKNDESLKCNMFTKAKVVKVPRLAAAESLLELQVTGIDESLDRAVITCLPLHGEVVRASPKPYCRGRFAALEAVIHATRVKAFLENGRRNEAEPLIQLILAYQDLARGVCPNSSYSSVVERVVDLVEQWKRDNIVEAR